MASHITQHNFARAPPTNWHEITDASTDDQPCRSALMGQITIRIENRSGKQAISVFKRDQLTTMKMPGENQIIAIMSGSFPDTRVVCAQDPNITIWQNCSSRTTDRDHSRTMRH